MAHKTVLVQEKKSIAMGIASIVVPWEEQVGAGQFFMLRRPQSRELLPRAISVCDWQKGQLRFLVQVVGPGTEELASINEGDELMLTGPLGNGFPVQELTGKVALVGGGIGVAPMLLTARELKAKGVECHALLGFRDEPFLHEAFGFCNKVAVSTETGRCGEKGFVTALLQPGDYDAVLCCGPEVMMKAVAGLCMQAGTPVYVSMENKMACGLGACLVCTCADKQGKNRRTCKDGPVFRGEEINFDA